MIFIGSRYENQDVRYVLSGRGRTTRPTVMRTEFRTRPPKSYVEWNQSFRMDQIAERIVVDNQNWWRIMEFSTPGESSPEQELTYRDADI